MEYEIEMAARRSARHKFKNREELEQFQRDKLRFLIQKVMPKSRFYQPYLGTTGDQWPVMSATRVRQNFNDICTVDLKFRDVFAQGVRTYARGGCWPEDSPYYVLLRHLGPKRWDISVYDPEEQRTNIGDFLAAIGLTDSLENIRVAHFFSDSSMLRRLAGHEYLDYQLYDLFLSTDHLREKLQAQQPDVIIAPHPVIMRIAYAKLKGRLEINPSKVVSKDGTLTVRDKMVLRRAFGSYHEVQSIGGNLLASSCKLGRLHLHEPGMLFEYHWIGEDCFIPVITSFHSHTVPIIRYKMHRIFVTDDTPCGCGSAHQSVKRMVSREDDVFWLPGKAKNYVPVFSRTLHDHGSRSVAWDEEYSIVQTAIDTITFMAETSNEGFKKRESELRDVLSQQGVDAGKVRFDYQPFPEPDNITPWHDRVRRERFVMPEGCSFD